MNYGALKAGVRTYLARPDLPDNVLDIGVGVVVEELNERLRTRAQETNTTLTATSGAVALPADFLQARLVYRLVDNLYEAVEIVGVEAFQRTRLNTEPVMAAINGSLLLINPPGSVESPLDVYLTYYARFTTPVADSDTGWLFTNAFNVMLFGLCREASGYTRDEQQEARYQARFEDAVFKLIRSEDTAEEGGAVRRLRGYYPEG